MKFNKITCVAVLTLSGIIASSAVVKAADLSTNTVSTNANGTITDSTGKTHKRAGGRGQNGEAMQELVQKLKLSDDQKAQTKTALQNLRTQLQSVNQEGSLTPQERIQKRQDAMDKFKEDMKTVLTPEQYTQFEDSLKDLRAKGAGMGRRAKDASTNAPTTGATNN